MPLIGKRRSLKNNEQGMNAMTRILTRARTRLLCTATVAAIGAAAALPAYADCAGTTNVICSPAAPTPVTTDIVLPGGGTITVQAGAAIQTSGSGTAAAPNAAISATGNSTTIIVNGSVATTGDYAPAISPSTAPNSYSSNITVGAGGSVTTSGSNSSAIVLTTAQGTIANPTPPSSITIAGSVRTTGANSSAIFINGAFAPVITINIASTGVVESTQGPAIASFPQLPPFPVVAGGINPPPDGVVDLTIAGTVRGPSANAVAIALGTGADRVTLVTGYSVLGTIDGGFGLDTMTLSGTGTGTLANTVNFEFLNVASGSWTIAGQEDFSAGGTQIQNSATLSVLGALTSSVNVASGGKLAGTGSVTNLTLQSGGTVAPGVAGVGTLTVNSLYTQSAGSIYAADIVNGTADRIIVGGTALLTSGARLNIKSDGFASVGKRYTLLTAGGGVTGVYAGSLTDDPNLDPRMVYTANSVMVDLFRSAQGVRVAATTPNQVAVASGITAIGKGNPIFEGLAWTSDDAAVRAGLDLLSGEIHASVRGLMTKDAELVQDAALSRLGDPASGVWLRVTGGKGDTRQTANTATVDRESYGAIGGVDFGSGGFRVGVAGGYTEANVHASLRQSDARLKTTHLLGYAAGSFGGLKMRAGIGYDWVRLETARNVYSPNFSDQLAANYDGNVLHGFAELGYTIPVGSGSAEPFVGAQAYRVSTDGFTERGGVAALQGRSRSETFETLEAGLQGTTPVFNGVSAHAKLSWQHRVNDDQPTAQLAFAAGGPDFLIDGAPLAKDAGSFGADVRWQARDRLRVSAGVDTTFAAATADIRGGVMLSLAF